MELRKISDTELRQILTGHYNWINKWVNSSIYGKMADFSYCDLSGKDLTITDLSHANFHGASLSGAFLAGGNFTNANFYDANLTNANLHMAFFLGANLRKAKFTVEMLHAWDTSCTLCDRAQLPWLLARNRQGVYQIDES